MGLDTVLVLVTRLLARGTVFIALAILARCLTVEELGVYGLITTSAFSVVYFFSLGLRHSSAYYIGKGLVSGSQVIASLFVCYIPLSVAVYISSFLFFHFFSSRAVGLDVSLLGAGSVFLMLFIYIFQGLFLGWKKISWFNTSEVVFRVVMLSALFAVWILDKSDVTLRLAVTLFFVGAFVAALYVLVRVWGSARSEDLEDRNVSYGLRIPWGMIKSGFPFAVSLSMVVLSPTVSIYLSGNLIGAWAGGVFFAAYKLADIVAEAATSAGMVVFSHGVRAKGLRLSLVRSLRTSWIVTIFSVFVAIFFVVFSDLLGLLMLGRNSRELGNAISILAFSLPFLSFARVINPALASQGFASSGAWVQIGTIAVNVVLALMLAPSYGVAGVAIALAFSRVVNAILFAIIFSRLVRLPFRLVVVPSRAHLFRTLCKLYRILRSRVSGLTLHR